MHDYGRAQSRDLYGLSRFELHNSDSMHNLLKQGAIVAGLLRSQRLLSRDTRLPVCVTASERQLPGGV